MTFRIDWDSDGTFDQTVTGRTGKRVSHAFARSGFHTIRVVSEDKDGGTGAEGYLTVRGTIVDVRPASRTPSSLTMHREGASSAPRLTDAAVAGTSIGAPTAG